MWPRETERTHFSKPAPEAVTVDVSVLPCRLRYFVKEWHKVTQDSFIISVLKGFKIPFMSVPVQVIEPPVKYISASEVQILSCLVAEYEKLGAVSESKEEEG